MGKHLLTKEERVKKSRKWRKFMNKIHHLERKRASKREEEILKRMNIRCIYK